MGIRIEQSGGAKAAAAAGTMIGAGEKAVRQQAEATVLRRQQMQIKAREAAEQRAFQWEQQKMEINSQRAFERELRVEDYKLAAEDRAVERGLAAEDRTAERALERIEFSKDTDFQYKVQERQRKLGVVDASDAGITEEIKSGRSKESDPAIIQLRFDNWLARREIETGTKPSDQIAEQRAVSRETRAEESAIRAEEIHAARMADDTPEKRERELNKAILGSWAKDLSLPEQRAELESLGLTLGSVADPSDVGVSPEELKRSAVGRSEAEKKLIYKRGVKLGYWN